VSDSLIARHFKGRWQGPGGYRELLVVAIPLILSTASWSVHHFVDRVFLTWYSPQAVAAALPAGNLCFTFMSLFMFTGNYVSTFVSQYHGAGRPERIGPSIWQGNYIAMIGGVVMLALIPFAEPLFAFIGHEPPIDRLETVYFQILCLGAFPAIASAAMSGLFAGLGRTWPIVWVNVAGTAVNLALDPLMIFGWYGFPEMGIAGAAWATVIAHFITFAIYAALLARPYYNRLYHTVSGYRFDRELFGRLIRYGAPSGVQALIDIGAFSVFILLLGRLGQAQLAASNIAFTVNTLAFMPMMGIGIALSVLVGQSIGKGRPDFGQRSTWSGFHLTLLYMSLIACLCFFAPDLLIKPFAYRSENPQEFQQLRPLIVTLLKFVAVYSVFDAMNIVFASAIKGAGDTRYVMFMIVVVAGGVLVVPSYIALEHLDAGLYAAWTIVSLYVIILGFSFLLRFLKGKWKTMRVIEEVPPGLPTTYPEVPAVEAEL